MPRPKHKTNTKRDKLYIFPDGSRTLGWKNLWISGSSDNPIKTVDLEGVPIKDLKQIEKNLYDDKILDKIKGKE